MSFPCHLKILSKLEVGRSELDSENLPASLRVFPEVGVFGGSAFKVQRIHRAVSFLYETRCTVTPKGDLLLMFPDGGHYSTPVKTNDMLAYRSKDGGKTWQGPTIPFDVDYDLHGFIPLIPRGSSRLYCFGTQPMWGKFDPHGSTCENAPIGYFVSDDDGYTWSPPQLIEPVNDPSFSGMSVVRMCETEAGTWLLGSHEGHRDVVQDAAGSWTLSTNQYMLRSEDKGASWTVVPGPRPNGWQCPEFHRMDETSPVCLGNGKVLALCRTPEGHLWHVRSEDDGRTWTQPAPTPLVHPDAPAMIFKLSDGTVAVLHHNRYRSGEISLEERAKLGEHQMRDRGQIWISLTRDGGVTWDAPRFVFGNALQPFAVNNFQNYNCSYVDMITHEGNVHLFLPHRWCQVLHLTMPEKELFNLPTAADLGVES